MNYLIGLIILTISQLAFAGHVYECESNTDTAYQVAACPEAKRQTVMCVDGYRVPSAPSKLAEMFEDCRQVAALRDSNNPKVSVDGDCIRRYWMKGDTVQQQRLAKPGECKTAAQVENEVVKDKEARIDYSGGNVTRVRSRTQYVSGHYRSNGTYVESYHRAPAQ